MIGELAGWVVFLMTIARNLSCPSNVLAAQIKCDDEGGKPEIEEVTEKFKGQENATEASTSDHAEIYRKAELIRWRAVYQRWFRFLFSMRFSVSSRI